MSSQVGIGQIGIGKIHTILDTKCQTYSALPVEGVKGNVINYLVVTDIDKVINKVTLKILDPKELTIEQCRNLVMNHEIVILQQDPSGIFFSVSEKLKQKFAENKPQLSIVTGKISTPLPMHDVLQFLNPEKYATVIRGFTSFLKLVLENQNVKK
jgi:hypothetical protein